ncbi:MAG: glycoside hydrolase family 2 [Prevotella sp.]|nr:glycoside hydrolase family 2 [Prevotella sp.]
MKKTILPLLILLLAARAAAQPVSVAGFFPLEDAGRIVFNFNEGWRFMTGDVAHGETVTLDDSSWPVVCAPHTVRLEPSEASGCRNYQGVCWYRKHFTMPQEMEGKEVTLHFEAVMGKQRVYVNGRLVKEHQGGYLPIIVNLNDLGVKAGDDCLVALMADNSDDKDYPPGKKQTQLDFAYHGGMYRDVWLIGKSSLHITDPLEYDNVAGGGVFLHYDNISEGSADIFIDVEVCNNSEQSEESLKSLKSLGSLKTLKTLNPTIEARVKDHDGKVVKTIWQKVAMPEEMPGLMCTATLTATLKNPRLWSPEDPYLYDVEVRIYDEKRCVDGGMVRMGIRKAEFKGKDGFWLNGKPYRQLVGGNRHQDFAYVGNALPNSQQWRDAKRLKEAGMNIIRVAHYPQDPAFMDACDELGLFVIDATPGWQYWNKDPEWGKKVHQNTREIIRRDRNHPCVLMWEPILNETRYPKEFALEALQITREEFPYPGRPVAAADMNSEGVKDNYDVLYDWADNIGKTTLDTDKCIFTREWGEYVDDWYAHNAINRAARGWGEQAMLTAALSLADTYGMMFKGRRQFIGGCQWHPFDHQRGYHPDAYLGGIYDAFRQKKYAFEAFRAQTSPVSQTEQSNLTESTEPMVFIAHEMTQYSGGDVVVFSNCDSVRLTAFEGAKTATLPVTHPKDGTPNAPVVFQGFWDFWQARDFSYSQRNWQKVSLLAEGIIGGKVVCTEKKMPARRSTRLRLYADEMGKPLVADGSDFIVVVAEVTDDNGNVRRNAREHVTFTVEGEGAVIGDESIMANPRLVEWGSAPILVRSTHQAGMIRIIAKPTFEGTYAPAADTLVIESVPYTGRMCHRDTPVVKVSDYRATSTPPNAAISEEERRKNLEEVEQQQQEFGIQK